MGRMKKQKCMVLFGWLLGLALAGAVEFTDDFHEAPGDGWSWIRENADGWRITDHGLEILVAPGNMWGGANNAKNILVRPIPDPADGPVDVSVRIQNAPTAQFEQVDLVWYYDDSHMVKIGQELVDGQLSIVMGREQEDRTRTIAIIPLDSETVSLRLRASGNQVTGYYMTPAMGDWKKAGECDLPVHGTPKITIQCYQGPADKEHWARITNFRMKQTGL
jgi:regulation of enolase protein 1 (concanavalin A-like superfamily)